MIPRHADQALQNPDSLLPLYIGFLAYDTFIGASAAQNKTAPLEGVTATSAAPGQTDSALEADKQTLLKHAFAILEGLWKENGKDFASEDVSAVKGRIEEVVGEMYVPFTYNTSPLQSACTHVSSCSFIFDALSTQPRLLCSFPLPPSMYPIASAPDTHKY